MHVAYIFSFLNTVINEEVIFKYYIFRRNLFMSTSTTYEEQKVKKTKSEIRKKWEELSPEEQEFLKTGLLIVADAVIMGVFIGERRMKKRLMKKKITLWHSEHNNYYTMSREQIDSWIKNETLSKRTICSLDKETADILEDVEYVLREGGTIKIELNDK
jgi:hypothetical protein